jgi:mono/diheme cytochrome c family protein
LTEIPEHLLERSRARRAALGLGGGEAAPAPATAEGGESPAPAAAAAPAKKAAAPAPVAAKKEPEVVLSPYAQAAIRRKKIPFWAVPVLLFLPLWAFLYWGTLDPAQEAASGPLAEGATIYAKCAGCHGASGGGTGSIPALTSVEFTFPQVDSHVWWVTNGSNAVSKGTPYGSPDRPGGQHVSQGGMPAWGAALSAKQLLEVVYYERVHFGGESATDPEITRLAQLIASPKLPANFKEGTTEDDIKAELDAIIPAPAG